MTSALLMISPTDAQTTTYTNLQEGGSIALPSGVTPDNTEETRAFLSFSPTVIGKGQTLLVNMWLNPALHVSRYFTGYQIIFTKPDGTTQTITKDSYRADTTAKFIRQTLYKLPYKKIWEKEEYIAKNI